MSFPNQQEPRPRSKSVLSTESFKTHRSRDSNGNKIDLTESPKDKRRLHSKADPTMAINEMQPCESPMPEQSSLIASADQCSTAFVALQESELENLRGIQHKDTQGHLISMYITRSLPILSRQRCMLTPRSSRPRSVQSDSSPL